MRPADRLELALAHARLGRDVFPFSLGPEVGGRRPKVPKVKWTTEATTDEDQIRRWWANWPAALPGWRLPPGVVVVDVDDPALFEAAGLDLPLDTASQLTPRGGYHLAFESDGREVRQTVKEVPGADTRVGGKGWVGLYERDSFSKPLRRAPEFLYSPRSTAGEHGDDSLEEMGTREEILKWLGTLRRARVSGPEMLALLLQARADGRIVDLDESRPWEDKDLRALAREASKWEPGPEEQGMEMPGLWESYLRQKQRMERRREERVGSMPQPDPSQVDLGRIVPMAEYRRGVPTEIPWVAQPFLYHGGVTLVAGPPKGGKSTLMAQLQRVLEGGGEFLGVRVQPAPALLVTEEGGIPVTHKAMGIERLGVLDRRAARDLTFREVLALVEAWCISRDEPAVVFIDTLAVWAGLEDENNSSQVTKALDLINTVAARAGAAIVLIHHTRKGGGKDGEAIRGSSAIFASVDIGVELSRPKEGSTNRQLDIQGRVILPLQLNLAFNEDDLSYRLANLADPGDFMKGLKESERIVAQALVDTFPDGMTLKELVQETDLGLSTVRAAITGLKRYMARVEEGPSGNKIYYMAPFAKVNFDD